MEKSLASNEQPFGTWLSEELSVRGWTQTTFAGMLAPFGTASGSMQSHVSKWLNGHRTPGRRSCAAIAAALDLPLALVLERAGRPQPDGVDDGPAATRLVALIRTLPEEYLKRLAPMVEELLISQLAVTNAGRQTAGNGRSGSLLVSSSR